jgi:hypothetical protein
MATGTKPVTYEEWLEMPVVADATEEVVNGEIRIMPPPKITHTLVVHAWLTSPPSGLRNRAIK